MQSNTSQNFQSNELADVLNECLPDKSKNVIESLINFIHAEKPKYLSDVKTPKHVTIPSCHCNMEHYLSSVRVVFEEKIPLHGRIFLRLV